jgi:hypothetical protein
MPTFQSPRPSSSHPQICHALNPGSSILQFLRLQNPLTVAEYAPEFEAKHPIFALIIASSATNSSTCKEFAIHHEQMHFRQSVMLSRNFFWKIFNFQCVMHFPEVEAASVLFK